MAISGPMVQRLTPFLFPTKLGGALLVSALAATAGCAGSVASPAGAQEPAAATTGASATTDESLTHGGASVFVVHSMTDFEGFKKYFEGGAAARAEAGIQGHLLTRLDDGRVVVHLFAPDAEKVQAVLKSPEMAAYIERKGAPESSLIWLTENELVGLPKVPPTEQTFSLYLKLRVRDFTELSRGFKQNLPLFSGQGVIGEGLHRSINKEDIAILHFVGTSRERLEGLVKRPEFIELLERAGNQEELKPLIGSDVSRSRPKTE